MKIRGEPGKYIPFDEVQKLLTAPAYGAIDLVKMGLFHTDKDIRSEIQRGHIKFQKVNKRAVVFLREHITEYWYHHRSEPYETLNNMIPLKVKISEADYLSVLVDHVQKRLDRSFSVNDLFRNFINYLKATGVTVESQPQFFVKP